MPPSSLSLRQAVQCLNQSHPIVRIGLSDAANFGHQSAGIEVARRLVVEGYAGTLELVTPSCVLDRLPPLLASLPPHAQVAVTTPDEAQTSSVRLAVYGGLDSVMRGGKPLPVNPEANAKVNADVCLILQPLQWPVPRAIARRSLDGQVQVQPLPLPSDAGFHYATYASERLLTVIDAALEQAGRPELCHPLQRIATAVQAGELELQLVYGLHQMVNYQATIDCLTDALTLCNRATPRPTLLLAVLPKASKQDQLTLTRLDAGDAVETELAFTLKQGSVQALQCHSLPEPAFRSLVQLSTYAPVLEGANTTNYVRMLGRAYLSCSVSFTSFDEVESFADVRERCLRVPRDLRMGESTRIASLLTEARDEHSRISGYFERLGETLRLPSRDQIAIGLAAAVEAMQGPTPCVHSLL